MILFEKLSLYFDWSSQLFYFLYKWW